MGRSGFLMTGLNDEGFDTHSYIFWCAVANS